MWRKNPLEEGLKAQDQVIEKNRDLTSRLERSVEDPNLDQLLFHNQELERTDLHQRDRRRARHTKRNSLDDRED
ncbi:unnamed protein product [Heligmosomoides polygyrus]|uniref:CCDC50_N domain-containing protein n=1 Tax=Heligmosomoides polygyrus TaxID=6339 RepID=A0A183FLG7_HELPZ|nr:unnamed protein product [Heligmosomoides polygyrus]